MNDYYLKVNLKNRNNKLYIMNYSLFKKDKLIKSYSVEQSKDITKKIKDNNISYVKKDDYYIVNDNNFIKDYVGLPAKVVSHIKSNISKYAILTALSASYLLSNTTSNIDNDYVLEIEDNSYSDDKIENHKLDYKPIKCIPKKVLKYSYEDRSNFECIHLIKENYGDIIERCSDEFGLDPNLVVALVSQENKNFEKNYNCYGGYGLLQVEYQVWNGYEANINGENTIIDCDRMNNDAEYGIRIGCWILRSYYNRITYLNNSNEFGFHLTDEQCLKMAIIAYNKGETIVIESLRNSNSIDDATSLITSTNFGDNQYLNNVLSYLPDETVLHIKDYNDNIVDIITDNLEVNNKKSL